MSKNFQYTFAGNDKIGDRSDVRSLEMENRENIAFRDKMHKLDIHNAQARIDFASRQCEKFKKQRDDIQEQVDDWLGFLHHAKKSMASLPDRHETERQEEQMRYHARHFELDPEKHRINSQDHSKGPFEAGPAWTVWDQEKHDRDDPPPKNNDHHELDHELERLRRHELIHTGDDPRPKNDEYHTH